MFANTEEGIVVQTDLATLRKAADRVLVHYLEFVEQHDGTRRPTEGNVSFGEAVVFKEDIDLIPAEIVAVKLDGTTWYVMSTSETPASGFPTAKDAAKAAESEMKRLRILRQFLEKQNGAVVKPVENWKPDNVADAKRILSVISDARAKYLH
ncbi:MAG: hypothetical protein HXY34_07190 [Candidatus Thorarchaeota archaeon]|nr:hypothetical protein [Candidatus Thorarchaeota archaeon]